MSICDQDPEKVLESLCATATCRTRRSLELLHGVCREQASSRNPDFTIATIGRESAAIGGPAAQSIRNTEGRHYRVLIDAWKTKAAQGARRSTTARADPNEALLGLITDASVRAMVGVLIAQNKKLIRENAILKSAAQVVVDMRPSTQDSKQAFTPLETLLPAEMDALRDSLTTSNLKRLGLVLDESTGRVTSAGKPVFKAGFASALQKVIAQLSPSDA